MFLSLVQQRRSIRRFDKKPVDQHTLDTLIEVALRAPSSRGFNPWEIIVVTEPDVLDTLSRAKTHGSSHLRNAPLGIVVCADPDKSDVWVEDCSIVSAFLLLALESLGLGGCWIQIRKRLHNDDVSSEAYVSDVLGLPEGYRVESIIAAGYPAEKLRPHDKSSLQYEKVFVNAYGKNAY
jgi:nitroreductase